MYAWNFDQIAPYIPSLLRGFAVTLWITGAATLLAAACVALLYSLRASARGPLRTVAVRLIELYIDIVQALPVIVALIWLYYCLPMLDIRLSADAAAILVLGVSFSAFAADLLFSAERGIPRGQIEIADISGMSAGTKLRKIQLPLVIEATADPLVGMAITTLKLSTFAAFIGSQEILSAANTIIARTYRPFEVYTLVALVFVAVILPFNYARRLSQRRVLPDRQGYA